MLDLHIIRSKQDEFYVRSLSLSLSLSLTSLSSEEPAVGPSFIEYAGFVAGEEYHEKRAQYCARYPDTENAKFFKAQDELGARMEKEWTTRDVTPADEASMPGNMFKLHKAGLINVCIGVPRGRGGADQ